MKSRESMIRPADGEANYDGQIPSIDLVTLQSLAEQLGEAEALRSCSPVSFYMLLRSSGYIPDEHTPIDFMKGLRADRTETASADWSRPSLSDELRQRYKAPIVSWVINGEELYGGINLDAMQAAGYVRSADEVEYFLGNIAGKDFAEVATSNAPVMVTVKPNFGDTGTNNIHSVIITSWNDDVVSFLDSDARNLYQATTPQAMRKSIDPHAAATIILPSNPY